MKIIKPAIILFIFLALSSISHSQIDYYHFDANRAERLMFAAINRIRLENDLPLFKTNNQLQRMADIHARDMINRDFFSHVNPDGDGPRERAKKIGIPFPVSENLGVLSSYGISMDKVVEKFMESLLESPEHRANLLNPKLTEIGISFKQDKDQTTRILDLEQISNSKLGYGTIVLCQTFMKRSLRELSPDPFPHKLLKGDSIHLLGETYSDFDSILIELEDTESKWVLRASEIRLQERRFEDNLIFSHSGKYDIRILGNRYETPDRIKSEILFSFNLSVE